MADRAVRSELLSMERLLVHTIYVRSLTRLNEIKTELQLVLKGVDCKYIHTNWNWPDRGIHHSAASISGILTSLLVCPSVNLQGTPAILTVPILSPCLRAEQMHITVDTHTGMFHCHVPKHLDCPLIPDLQQALNNDHGKLLHLISELRYWITCRRCEKTLQHLPATCHDGLPLRFTAANEAKMRAVGKHRVFIKLHRHQNVVLIVELNEKAEQPTEIEYTFYLAMGTYEANDTTATDATPEATQNTEQAAKLYLKVSSIVQFDTFVNTHGPGTYVDEVFVSNAANLAALAAGAKRKAGEAVPAAGPAPKQPKSFYPAYFIPELAHIVAMCDEKLQFVTFARALSAMSIPHSGLQVEANATTLGLKILALPRPKPVAVEGTKMRCTSPPTISDEVWKSLMKRLLGTTLRLHLNRHNQTRSWTMELVFYSSPLVTAKDSQALRKPVYLQHDVLPAEQTDKTISLFLEGWSRIVNLYALVHEFAEVYTNGE